MSSNIQIVKVCCHCGKDFIAKTTVTKFCSKGCNSRYYKAEIRKEKIIKSNISTVSERSYINSANIDKHYLSVSDVCKMLGISKPTVYRMIESGILRATNLTIRCTRILRDDINDLFLQQNSTQQDFDYKQLVLKTDKTKTYAEDSIKEWFSVTDLMILFNKKRTAIYTALSRANVPKKKIGKEVYFEHNSVMKLLRKSEKPKQSAVSKQRFKNQKAAEKGIEPSQCYSIEECVTMFRKKRSLLYGIFNRRLIPKIREGQKILLSKKAIDKLYKSFLKDGLIN